MGETPWDRSGRRDPPQAAFPRARRGHRGGRRARRGRPGGRRARRPTRGHPPRPVRGRRLSKSATKAPIEPERTRRNVDIPRFCSPPIPPRGAFVADLDTPPPRVTPGAPPAPHRHPQNNLPAGGAGEARRERSQERGAPDPGVFIRHERIRTGSGCVGLAQSPIHSPGRKADRGIPLRFCGSSDIGFQSDR